MTGPDESIEELRRNRMPLLFREARELVRRDEGANLRLADAWQAVLQERELRALRRFFKICDLDTVRQQPFELVLQLGELRDDVAVLALDDDAELLIGMRVVSDVALGDQLLTRGDHSVA